MCQLGERACGRVTIGDAPHSEMQWAWEKKQR